MESHSTQEQIMKSFLPLSNYVNYQCVHGILQTIFWEARGGGRGINFQINVSGTEGAN